MERRQKKEKMNEYYMKKFSKNKFSSKNKFNKNNQKSDFFEPKSKNKIQPQSKKESQKNRGTKTAEAARGFDSEGGAGRKQGGAE